MLGQERSEGTTTISPEKKLPKKSNSFFAVSFCDRPRSLNFDRLSRLFFPDSSNFSRKKIPNYAEFDGKSQNILFLFIKVQVYIFYKYIFFLFKNNFIQKFD